MLVLAETAGHAGYVVDATDLEAAGVDDLADAISMVAGVFVRVGGQGEARVDVRGSKQRAACVTLDGVPVTDPWDGAFDLGRIPLSQVSSVGWEPGPVAELPGCSAGVVRVVLRSPEGERGAQGHLEAGSGWRLGLVAEARPWRSSSVGLVARGWQGWPVPSSYTPLGAEDGGTRDLSDARMLSATWQGLHSTERFSLRGSWHGLVGAAGVPPDGSIRPRFRRQGPMVRQQLGARAAWEPRHDLTLSAGLGGAFLHLDTGWYEDASLATLEQLDRVDAVHGRASAAVLAVATPWLSLGLDGAATESWARVHQEAGEVSRDSELSAVELASRASALLRPHESVELDLVGGVHAWKGPVTGVGRAEARWHPQHMAIRAAVSRSARAPTLRERADPERGNPDLGAEVVEVAEAGLGARVAGVQLDLSAWTKQVDGWIASPDDGYGDKVYTNLDHVAFRGLDATAVLTPVEPLRLRATWTWSARLAGAVDTLPAHQGRLTARWQAPWQLTADLDLTASSAWDWGAVALDPWWVADAQVQKSLGDHLWLGLRVDNLFDALYEERPLEPRPGRTFLVRVGGRTWTPE